MGTSLNIGPDVSPVILTDDQTRPLFALVIPMKDEAENVVPLLTECIRACNNLGRYQICVTNDGSTDATAQNLETFANQKPTLDFKIITHATASGQSAAVHNAVLNCDAPIICTLDGDGQNPPTEIPKLVKPLLSDQTGRLALVAGQRTKRQDSVSKKWASKAANTLRSALLKDGTRDTGCGLKAFRRDAFLALPYFNHMHRFLPALFIRDGWQIELVDVAHKERLAGQSKYTNLGRALVGITDLLGVAWLIRRRKTVVPFAAKVTSNQKVPE